MRARLFVHHRTPPYFNMGFDEWMLAAASRTPGAIMFRLYTWEPGTITFGFNQRQSTAIDFSRVGETPVIRRITGGRAVFHDISELTYSVAFNSHSPGAPGLSGSTSQTSEIIAGILARLLAAEGIRASWVKRSSAENSRSDFFHKAACFASHAKYELTADGAKVVASARRDWGGAVLQHGSIKIGGLAEHPALHYQPTGAGPAPKSVELSILNRYAGALTEAVAAELGVATIADNLTVDEASEVDRRVGLVAASPLEKREMIAQSSGAVSQ